MVEVVVVVVVLEADELAASGQDRCLLAGNTPSLHSPRGEPALFPPEYPRSGPLYPGICHLDWAKTLFQPPGHKAQNLAHQGGLRTHS